MKNALFSHINGWQILIARSNGNIIAEIHCPGTVANDTMSKINNMYAIVSKIMRKGEKCMQPWIQDGCQSAILKDRTF